MCYSVDGCLLLLGDDEASLSTLALLALFIFAIVSSFEEKSLELFGMLGNCLLLRDYVRCRAMVSFEKAVREGFVMHWDLAGLLVW